MNLSVGDINPQRQTEKLNRRDLNAEKSRGVVTRGSFESTRSIDFANVSQDKRTLELIARDLKAQQRWEQSQVTPLKVSVIAHKSCCIIL